MISRKSHEESLKNYMIPVTFSAKMIGYYFDKEHGVIIRSNGSNSINENEFFQKLQAQVNEALIPLIEIVQGLYEIEVNRYLKTGARLTDLPPSDPASKILDLISVLCCDQRFHGKYKLPLPSNAIATKQSNITIDKLANTLAELTNTEVKDSYKLLLKLNACKNSCCVEYKSHINLSSDNRYSLFQKNSPEYYSQGIDELGSFADFLKKIEKSIAYLVVKSKRVNDCTMRNE
ncbi:MAG: hypothetical protein WC627_13120 [Legionella sp.]|jgi:hypothetical protein